MRSTRRRPAASSQMGASLISCGFLGSRDLRLGAPDVRAALGRGPAASRGTLAGLGRGPGELHLRPFELPGSRFRLGEVSARRLEADLSGRSTACRMAIGGRWQGCGGVLTAAGS